MIVTGGDGGVGLAVVNVAGVHAERTGGGALAQP